MMAETMAMALALALALAEVTEKVMAEMMTMYQNNHRLWILSFFRIESCCGSSNINTCGGISSYLLVALLLGFCRREKVQKKEKIDWFCVS